MNVWCHYLIMRLALRKSRHTGTKGIIPETHNKHIWSYVCNNYQILKINLFSRGTVVPNRRFSLIFFGQFFDIRYWTWGCPDLDLDLALDLGHLLDIAALGTRDMEIVIDVVIESETIDRGLETEMERQIRHRHHLRNRLVK